MQQQKKFSNHAMPARRPRKTQGKCVLFADAAKLYIEYSKAVTSAETAVKRMRFFAQFYNAAFAERNIASISPSDVYRWFDGVITAKHRDGKGCYAPRTLRSVWGQLYTFFSSCSTRYPVQNPMYAIKMPRTRAAERNMTFWEISEFRKFISHVDDVTWRAFFTFRYYTGCRIGETLALQEKDYSGGAVRIDKSLSKQPLTDAHFEIKSTKTGKRRTVPPSPLAAKDPQRLHPPETRPREPARQPACRRCPHTLSAATRPARDRVRLRAARTRYVQNNTLLLDTMHTKWYHTLTS